MLAGPVNAGTTSHVGEMVEELQWPGLQEWKQWASLTFFCKIHNNLVTIDKYRYLSEAGGDRSTRSHPFQYHRPNAYTDRLKFSFSPRTIATWNGLTTEAVTAEYNGNNLKTIQTRVMVLVLCTSSNDTEYLYEVSRTYYIFNGFMSSLDRILLQNCILQSSKGNNQKNMYSRVIVVVLCTSSYDA